MEKGLLSINYEKISGKRLKEFLCTLEGTQDKIICKVFNNIYSNINESTIYKVVINEDIYDSFFKIMDINDLDEKEIREIVKDLIKIVKIKNFSNLSIHELKYFLNLNSFMEKIKTKYNLSELDFIVEDLHGMYRFRTIYVNTDYKLPNWVEHVLKDDYGMNLILSFKEKNNVLGNTVIMNQGAFDKFSKENQKILEGEINAGRAIIIKRHGRK